jgi:glycosyltransferase involved in cell wall biosynthesis
MHILHLTPYYTPAYAFGGVVRAVEGMTRALARHGHHLTVLTTDALNQTARCDRPSEEIIDGVRVIRVSNVSPGLRGRFNLSTPRGMRPLAQTLVPDADIVHCHEFRTVENLLVTPVAADLGKPLVLSPHGTLALETGRSRLKSTWDRILSPAVAQRFDHVVGLSQQEIESVQTIWPRFGRRMIPTTFSVIPNGIDPADYDELPGGVEFREKYFLGSDPVILFMGRLHPRKGVDILARAFKKASISGAHLVIAGPDEGMLNRLQPLLDEYMVITGYLDGEERLAALAAANMLVLPAVGEGLSMVVLEAMGAGLPVILSPGCNFPEATAFGAGLEVEPQVEPLAEAIRTLLLDPDRRIEMGHRAQQLIRERYTWDSVAEQLENLYQRLIVQAGEQPRR